MAIANTNPSSQTVIAGVPPGDLEDRAPLSRAMNGTFVPLNTSGPSHLRYMAPIKAEFEEYLGRIKLSALGTPVIANVSAEPYQQAQLRTTWRDRSRAR